MQRCEVRGTALLRFHREDGDKVGHFTIAIVFKSYHLSLAIQRGYLPEGPTYINRSDKRDALTAFLSPRLQYGHKRAFVDSHFHWMKL